MMRSQTRDGGRSAERAIRDRGETARDNSLSAAPIIAQDARVVFDSEVSSVKLFLLLVVFAPLVMGAGMNGPRQDSKLDQIVVAERTFAKAGAIKGKRDAFLEYFTDDIVLFPPGSAITIGKDGLRAEPESITNLFWEPTWADVSAAGDMGFTTGPWQFRPKGINGEIAAVGYFASVWKRQPDGTLKVVVDIGVGGVEPVEIKGGLEPKAPGATANKMTPEALRESLAAAERELAAAARAGTPGAYFATTTDQSILHRMQRKPAIGAASIRDALSAMKVTYAWQPPLGLGVSDSGDLGYTYGDGAASFDASANTPAANFHYARFWKRQTDGRWKIVLEVASPGIK
jgi:ketosteroid isomerase-like protein